MTTTSDNLMRILILNSIYLFTIGIIMHSGCSKDCTNKIQKTVCIFTIVIFSTVVVSIGWCICDALKHLYTPYEMVGIATVEKKNVEKKNVEISDNACPICLDPCIGEIGVLHCNHEFHIGCITQWFKFGHGCPLCRNV